MALGKLENITGNVKSLLKSKTLLTCMIYQDNPSRYISEIQFNVKITGKIHNMG